jgi:type IV pilus assembly protein PilC
MPKFAYVAVTPDGQQVKGRTRATSRGDAEVALYGKNLRDLRVKERTSILKYEISGPRIKKADVMHLSRQIAAFLRAGLPILEAVHTIGAESESSSVRRMMNDIEDGLRTGERFSDCLDRYDKVFPGFYRGMVRSAELTGELDTVLARLAIYIERDLEARRKIKSALIYPAAVAIMSVVTVLVLSIYVLPKFADFFADLDATLPLPTRMLMAVTDFLGTWWWALTAALGLVIFLGFLVTRFHWGKYARDAFILKVPVLG